MVKRRRKPVVQMHHIRYKGVKRFVGDDDREWQVPLFAGEHYAVWLIQRRKRISRGLIISMLEALKVFGENGCVVELKKT